jgi:alpha-glucosidase (family GH31 glycosyl hydrolase)
MSAAEVHGIADRLRAEHIPSDVIWLDIDYQDRNRPFTTNPATFPDLPALTRELRQQGLRLVVITDLHIAAAPDQGYSPYDSGIAGDPTVRPSAKPVPATVGAPMSQEITVTPALDRLPVFVRAGAILPGQPLVQSTSQTPQGPLSLDVYPGEDCRGTIYADDGHSMTYAQQGYLRQRVRCVVTDAGMDLDFDAREGRFQPWWHQVAVRVHHWRGGAQAFLDGKRIADPVTQAGVLRVTIDDPSGQSRLSLKAGVRSN